MKKHFLSTLAYSVCFFAGIAVGYSTSPVNTAPDTPPVQAVADVSEFEPMPQQVSTEPAETFYLIAENGVINVYNCIGNKKELLTSITYIDLISLDNVQKEIVSNGISFQNKLALAEFIENLDS